jgi:hypothetical protein
MRTQSPTPTQQRVKELYQYDLDTGLFARINPSRGKKESKIGVYGQVGAGKVTELGYVMLPVDGFRYNAGSLAWLYTTGEWPKRLKYINGIKTDNRMSNLRVNSVDKKEVERLKSIKISYERLKELLHYDPSTGWFTWLIDSSMTKKGERAGGHHSLGYRQIGIDYQKYLEHHLVVFYMTGEWPKFEIDHINHIRDDNRLCNIRDISRSANGHNKGLHTCNTSGYTGVSRHGNAWRSYISVNGKMFYLGRFGTLAEARVSRILEEIKRFGYSTTWNEEKDSKLQGLDGNFVEITLYSSEYNGERTDCLGVKNHHGVPFWVKGIEDITGIIVARLAFDEDNEDHSPINDT